MLGNLFDIHEIDEVHAFIGPKLIGGAASAAGAASVSGERSAASAAPAGSRVRDAPIAGMTLHRGARIPHARIRQNDVLATRATDSASAAAGSGS